MDHYLSKPVRRAELTAVLDSIASQREADEAAPGDPADPADPASTATPSRAGAEIGITRAVLRQRVMELVGDEDPEFEQELIDTFLADLPDLTRTLHEERASADQLRRAAHTLKSQVAVFGADDVVESCRALEHAAAGAGATDEQIDEVLRGLDDVARALGALRDPAP
jgi:HPt (histidine-containing phosphotransfer) domain-containing protein